MPSPPTSASEGLPEPISPDGSNAEGSAGNSDGSSADNGVPPACSGPDCVASVSLSIAFEGDGAGQVTWAYPGFPGATCQQSCSITVPIGTTLALTASPGLNSVLRGWSEASCGAAGSCQLQLDTASSLRVEFELGYDVAFITSQRYMPATMPLPGAAANQECARLAAAAGLHGTRWVAWLASDGASVELSDDVEPLDFFQSSGGWVRPDGKPVARTRAKLLAGEILHPIVRDEFGGVPLSPGFAWGNVGLGAITASFSADCNGWSSADGSLFGNGIPIGGLGVTFYGGFNTPCNQAFPMHCFGDDSNLEVPVVTPAPNRLAFLSTQEFLPSGGIAAADQVCQRDACEAGLTGSANCAQSLGAQRTFKAYLHTSTTPGWERFDLDGPTWVRADGVQWLPEARTLAADGRGAFTALNVTLDLDYLTSTRGVWLGNTDGTNTCNDWTSQTAQTASTIYDIFDVESLGSFETTSCDRPARLYCLEE